MQQSQKASKAERVGRAFSIGKDRVGDAYGLSSDPFLDRQSLKKDVHCCIEPF
jgi:hypothetical protein